MKFHIPSEKCRVISNATVVPEINRSTNTSQVLKLAYTSTPFRGLDILLDAWERLAWKDAELLVWSSMRLYGQSDDGYRHLLNRAASTPGVRYLGLAPNDEILEALQDVDILSYPCTFRETSCISVIEAMSAGCRVVVPALGALPETTAGFASIYPWSGDYQTHLDNFCQALEREKERLDFDAGLQQDYCRARYDWTGVVKQWKDLVNSLI